MSQIILCVTDHPERFNILRRQAFARNIVLVTSSRLRDVLEYLRGPDTIVGITLDFEMPFGTGSMFVKYLHQENISSPIVITEIDKYGIKKVKESLKEIGFDNYTVLPYNGIGWEEKAMNFWIIKMVPEVILLSEFIFNSEPFVE